MNSNAKPNPTAPPPWFLAAIDRGIQSLLPLALDGQPGMEFIGAGLTPRRWAEVLWPGIAWDEQADTGRIAAAFDALAGKVTRWPSPAEWRQHLPPRRLVSALPPVVLTEAQREANMRRLHAIVGGLGIPTNREDNQP